MATIRYDFTKIMATVRSINNFGTSPFKYYCHLYVPEDKEDKDDRPFYLLYAVPVSHKEICAMSDSEFFEDLNAVSKYFVRETFSSTSIYRYLDVIFHQCLHMCKFKF